MIQFGLSFYGLTCFSKPELLMLRDYCRANKCTFLRVWLTWWGNDEQDLSTIVRPDFSINYSMLEKLKWFMEKAPEITLHLTYLRNNSGAFPYTAKTIARELKDYKVTYDVANELHPGYAGINKAAKASQYIKQEDPDTMVSVSSAGAINTQMAAFNHYHQAGGIIDMIPSHVDRNDREWGYNTKGWFDRIQSILDSVNADIPMWDDEGARVGDENAGGGPLDPTIQQWEANFKGAKAAGCTVTVLHTAAFFNRGNVNLWTPTEARAFTLAKGWLDL